MRAMVGINSSLIYIVLAAAATYYIDNSRYLNVETTGWGRGRKKRGKKAAKVPS